MTEDGQEQTLIADARSVRYCGQSGSRFMMAPTSALSQELPFRRGAKSTYGNKARVVFGSRRAFDIGLQMRKGLGVRKPGLTQ